MGGRIFLGEAMLHYIKPYRHYAVLTIVFMVIAQAIQWGPF